MSYVVKTNLQVKGENVMAQGETIGKTRHAMSTVNECGQPAKYRRFRQDSGTNGVMTDYANDSRFPGPDPYAPLKDLPSFTLTSTDLVDGDEIPEKFQAPESNSPQLAWSNLPEGTKSLAVTCFDPDAPTASGFWHWAAFNIPADVSELPTNAGEAEDLGIKGVKSLVNDSGERTHFGAQPPEGHGPHRYLYAVHAVDTEEMEIPEDASPTVLGFNLHFHAIGRAILWGWDENK